MPLPRRFSGGGLTRSRVGIEPFDTFGWPTNNKAILLRELLPILCFVIGVSFITFLGGIGVGHYQYPPYDLLKQAKDAVDAYRKRLAFEPNPHSRLAESERRVVAHDPSLTQQGLTFATGHFDGSAGAVLMDLHGRVVHRWQASFSDVWTNPPHIQSVGSDDEIVWHGSHLFPNGDVVFTFEGGNFPPGGGLVRIDRDSKIVWKLAINSHHDVSVSEDGTIFTVASHWRANRDQGLRGFPGPFFEDYIAEVSADGRLLNEYPIMRAFLGSDYEGIFSVNYFPDRDVHLIDDPSHTNNIDILPRSLADQFPQFSPGDLLVSMREINTIAVIGRQSKRVKWALTALFDRQHDPDFLENGNLIVLDNRGAPSRQTRVLEINPGSGAIEWRYQEVEGSGSRFYIKRMGNQQMLPNGNVLITLSEDGRAIEVKPDRKSGVGGEIVWEYRNLHYADEGDTVGENRIVTEAIRIPPDFATFLK